MKQLTDANFKAETSETEFTLVMFSAPWAGPCNMVRPAFAAVASRFGNQMVFGEFSLDDNPSIPEYFGVRGVPTFYLLRRGIPQVVKTGTISEEDIVNICEGVLDNV